MVARVCSFSCRERRCSARYRLRSVGEGRTEEEAETREASGRVGAVSGGGRGLVGSVFVENGRAKTA